MSLTYFLCGIPIYKYRWRGLLTNIKINGLPTDGDSVKYITLVRQTIHNFLKLHYKI